MIAARMIAASGSSSMASNQVNAHSRKVNLAVESEPKRTAGLPMLPHSLLQKWRPEPQTSLYSSDLLLSRE
jgi:hypothetical protein